LTNGVTVLNLPDDILWIDEFNWTAVQERRQFSVAPGVRDFYRIQANLSGL
jgi:hypothetical protein